MLKQWSIDIEHCYGCIVCAASMSRGGGGGIGPFSSQAWFHSKKLYMINTLINMKNNHPTHCGKLLRIHVEKSIGPVTHTITQVQRTKRWRILVSALWFARHVSRFVDDLTRTPDESYLFFLCVNLCAHFLHVKKCERFPTCECRCQKNVRPASI